MNTNLSKDFYLEEMILSPTATRKGIEAQFHPSQTVINNLNGLCEHILQPLRDKLGKPIRVTSGYRCPELNKAIGGANNSQHIQGQAADINVPGMTVEELYQAIRKSGLPYDQLIQEFGQWVHVSYSSATARGEAMRATKVNGATAYTDDNTPINQA